MDAGGILFLSLAATFSFGLLLAPHEKPQTALRAALDLLMFASCAVAVPLIFASALAATTFVRPLSIIAVLIFIAWAAFALPRLVVRISTLASFVGWTPRWWEALTGLAFLIGFGAVIGALVSPKAAGWIFLATMVPAATGMNAWTGQAARRIRVMVLHEQAVDRATLVYAFATYRDLRLSFGMNFLWCAGLLGFGYTNLFFDAPGSGYGPTIETLALVLVVVGLPWVASGIQLHRVQFDEVPAPQPGKPWPPRVWPSWP